MKSILRIRTTRVRMAITLVAVMLIIVGTIRFYSASDLVTSNPQVVNQIEKEDRLPLPTAVTTVERGERADGQRPPAAIEAGLASEDASSDEEAEVASAIGEADELSSPGDCTVAAVAATDGDGTEQTSDEPAAPSDHVDECVVEPVAGSPEPSTNFTEESEEQGTPLWTQE